MAGRLDPLKTIVRNTFSVYIASRRDLLNVLNNGVIVTVSGNILYLRQGHSTPFVTPPPHLKHKIEFRRIEGMSGLIGVIRKESPGLILIEYSPVLFEEYEDHLSIFADECKTRARQNSPVILLASYTDSVIMELGSCADRFLSISDNGKRSKKTDKNEKYQITLADPGIFGIPKGTMVVPPVRYGQLSLDVG